MADAVPQSRACAVTDGGSPCRFRRPVSAICARRR
jgi:hypothetical protein